MLFNSGEFLLFFAGFLLAWWLVRGRSICLRNQLIVAASYLFYAWWDWRFLPLLVGSSLIDFWVALRMDETADRRRKRSFLIVSLCGNLGLLAFFKYFNFFAGSLHAAAGRLGLHLPLPALEIILPVGISFYTFQTLSYTIDVYRGVLPATRRLTDFLAYVSFFPQLVAGPIERAAHLLPQFAQTREITLPMVREGVWLILWGLFKKVVMADNLAPLVEMVYDGPDPFTAPAVLLGTLAFAFQIYGDFSGYSDIARGTARLMGFDIMFNFNLPYAARSLSDFWRRWHISLSAWLRDYVYIPLGGNRRGTFRTQTNLLITMMLGGLWHGASWHFVLWGLWHGFGLISQRIWLTSPFTRWNVTRLGASAGWLVTMLFVLYGWLLFRADSWEEIVAMTTALGAWETASWHRPLAANLLLFTAPVIAMELWQWRRKDLLVALTLNRWPAALIGAGLFLAILLYWETRQAAFLYFQF